MRLLAFIFGEWVYVPYSFLIKLVMRGRGIKIGRNFHIEAVPCLKIRGRAGNIVLGDDITITGVVDLRNRENGKIVIEDGCKLDHGVRIVAANNAVVRIGRKTNIGCYSILNCGDDVTIGEKCLIAGFAYIQSSDHGTKKGISMKEQKHTYGPIRIGDDVWLGSHVSVLKGVSIQKGAVVGSKAVVTKDVAEDEIVAGVPAKHLSTRE